MSKRVLAMFMAILAFFIFVGSPFNQSVAAVVVVDDALIAIIIATLAGMGITFTMTGTYSTVTDWIRSEITSSGIDFAGSRYGADNLGRILINNTFIGKIAVFAQYLIAKYGVQSNSTVTVVESGIFLGDIVVYPGTYWSFTNTNQTQNIAWKSDVTTFTIFIAGNGGIVQPLLYNDDRFTCQWHALAFLDQEESAWNSPQQAIEYDQTDYYYRIGMWFSPSSYIGASSIVKYNYTVEQIMDLISGKVQSQKEELILHADVLEIPTNQEIDENGAVITLPIPWGQTLPETLDDIPDLTFNDELAGEVDLELETMETIEENVSDTATDTGAYVSTNVSDYMSPGLQSVFPFCIPFDIYAFFECLAAEPEAPSFTWRFYIPGICDEDLKIDLAAFDSAARILRTMELLLFIVGLAFVTRDKFLRG